MSKEDTLAEESSLLVRKGQPSAAPNAARVIMPSQICNALITEARIKMPYETIGALVGSVQTQSNEQTWITIKEAVPIEIKPGPTPDRRELIDLRSRLVKTPKADLRIVGWYYTDPGMGTFPPRLDIVDAQLAFGPDAVLLLLINPYTNQGAFYIWQGSDLIPMGGFYEALPNKHAVSTIPWTGDIPGMLEWMGIAGSAAPDIAGVDAEVQEAAAISGVVEQEYENAEPALEVPPIVLAAPLPTQVREPAAEYSPVPLDAEAIIAPPASPSAQEYTAPSLTQLDAEIASAYTQPQPATGIASGYPRSQPGAEAAPMHSQAAPAESIGTHPPQAQDPRAAELARFFDAGLEAFGRGDLQTARDLLDHVVRYKYDYMRNNNRAANLLAGIEIKLAQQERKPQRRGPGWSAVAIGAFLAFCLLGLALTQFAGSSAPGEADSQGAAVPNPTLTATHIAEAAPAIGGNELTPTVNEAEPSNTPTPVPPTVTSTATALPSSTASPTYSPSAGSRDILGIGGFAP